MFCNIYRQVKKLRSLSTYSDKVIITHLGVVSVAIIKENVTEMKAEISLVGNMIYVVKDGKIHPIEPPTTGHGEQSFVYKSGKVTRMDERKTQLI